MNRVGIGWELGTELLFSGIGDGASVLGLGSKNPSGGATPFRGQVDVWDQAIAA